MVYAQQMIESGMKSTKVAEKCGYENYSTFYRVYKRYFKLIPYDAKKGGG